VPGKDFGKKLWWSFPERPSKTNKAASGEEKLDLEMTFTGTLIEDLMATVERVERRSESNEPLFNEPLFRESLLSEQMFSEPLLCEASLSEGWFVSVQETLDCDSKFIGMA
jgi:hypothetical protein